MKLVLKFLNQLEKLQGRYQFIEYFKTLNFSLLVVIKLLIVPLSN